MVLHLVEEVGEVVRAVRREDWENLEEELADTLFYILAAANEAKVDLASAFARKEQRNRDQFGA
jgi:NTP pyrophosphatase (non-canonical NTP hydrolase)